MSTNRFNLDFVAVALPAVVYIGVASRAAFDKLDRPAIDHGEKPNGEHVITKTVEQDGVLVIFQHWVKSSPLPTGGAA